MAFDDVKNQLIDGNDKLCFGCGKLGCIEGLRLLDCARALSPREVFSREIFLRNFSPYLREIRKNHLE